MGYDGSDEDYLTPSPSDSAVADLEIVLKVIFYFRLVASNPKYFRWIKNDSEP